MFSTLVDEDNNDSAGGVGKSPCSSSYFFLKRGGNESKLGGRSRPPFLPVGGLLSFVGYDECLSTLR